MEELVIGTTKPSKFNSHCMWYGADASENSIYYILNCDITDTRIYIYKDSTEGIEIKEWLSKEQNQNNDSVQRKALAIVMPYLSVDDFFEIINREKLTSWNDGYKKAQYDIRKALGL
jgi:hypothetical protein